MDPSKPRPAFKVWMETDEGYVFGPGVYSLLKRLEETGTLKEAAASLDMSYRYAWGLIKKAEGKLGAPLISAHKGGRHGGGGVELTDLGRQYLLEFTRLREQVSSLSMGRQPEPSHLDGVLVKLVVEDDLPVAFIRPDSAAFKVTLPTGGLEGGIRIGDEVTLIFGAKSLCAGGSQTSSF
jgi:molybdate transport repressor ModE-like protein